MNYYPFWATLSSQPNKWLAKPKVNIMSKLDTIEDVINRLVPQEETRNLCLKMFSEAIKYAASCGQDKWGVHGVPSVIQLLVGNFIVFTIEKGGVWFALDDQLLNSSEI
jgi:hypothetical protein